MNANEAAFAKVLEEWKAKGEVLFYSFESLQLILAPRTTLLLDFHAVMSDGTLVFYECKAGMKNGRYRVEEDANVKMKLAAEKFPYLRIIITWAHKTYPRKYKEVGAHGVDDITVNELMEDA